MEAQVAWGVWRVLDASAGDADPVYRACTEHCKETGCVGDRCFPHCRSSLDGTSSDGLWYSKEHLKLQWKQGLCQSDCCYYCMLNREKDREALGYGPIKYHGKWPFKRIYGFQEPASVALSALNLGMHFHGWLSFFNLLKNKLPPKKDKKTDSGFTSLWHVYGLLSMNSWFWSAVFHGRGMDLTQKLNYSSVVALLGYSLILAVIRTFNLRTEAAQVMAAAPLLAFTITHIFFLNIYQFAYDVSQLCSGCHRLVMVVTTITIWAVMVVVVVMGNYKIINALVLAIPCFDDRSVRHQLEHLYCAKCSRLVAGDGNYSLLRNILKVGRWDESSYQGAIVHLEGKLELDLFFVGDLLVDDRYSFGGALNMRVSTEFYRVLASFILLWRYKENIILQCLLHAHQDKKRKGWNMMVCVTMGISQLLLWAMWAGVTCHPSRWKLWMVVFGGALAMLLEVYDFPPYHGFLDAHALRHATTIPLTYIWWSFIKDDIEYCRSNLAKKKR
ncbi:Per1-like [Dillenia turbinata]|uniref:Post-GPI attachment to proteins factor 3 n=1 Tax=Dillenia turbinata TaxID=194707 RepID=A0AAN8VJI2_9MAGN